MKPRTFSKTSQLPVSAQEALAWHEQPGAFERLIPPWETVEVTNRGNGIRDGSVVELVTRLGPLRLRWLAEHCDFIPGEQFRDIQRSGPFSEWVHTHRFRPSHSGSTLEDEIHYRIPLGAFGNLVGGRLIRDKIERMFDYRHRTTIADLTAHKNYRGQGIMNIAITGSTGLVGSELTPLLTTGGHQVTPIVRHNHSNAEAVTWDPQAESFDASPLEGIDAVVHLAGENIAAGRWNPALKERIRQSRIHGTRILSEGLARLEKRPRVLVSASAIGFYGDRGDELLDEQSTNGDGFLAEVARDWEAATQPARDAGIRVVHLRFGVVLSPKGGALAKMLTPFKLGGGGIVGDGKQYWSWITVGDAAGAILHALMTDSLVGPVNAVAPQAVTNHEFTKTLGRVLSRPTIFPLPAFMAKLMLGEMADELLLSSLRVQPSRLLESGYSFRHPNLEEGLRDLLGKAN